MRHILSDCIMKGIEFYYSVKFRIFILRCRNYYFRKYLWRKTKIVIAILLKSYYLDCYF